VGPTFLSAKLVGQTFLFAKFVPSPSCPPRFTEHPQLFIYPSIHTIIIPERGKSLANISQVACQQQLPRARQRRPKRRFSTVAQTATKIQPAKLVRALPKNSKFPEKIHLLST
jgi:hypothetical protein